MNYSGALIFGITTLFLTGCAIKPSGPKLYNNAILATKANNTLVVPSDLAKDFLETIRIRVEAITQVELLKQGDMGAVEVCGPQVMKFTQDITQVAMSQNVYAKRGFLGGVTQDTKQAVTISTNLKIEDCLTGKILYSYDYTESGDNPMQVLQNLVSYNMYLAYQNQRALK